LTDKYDTVAAQLTALERTTDAVRAGVEQQRTQVEAMITDVEGAVREVRDGEKGREAQMKRISDEVEEMKRALPKVSLPLSTRRGIARSTWDREQRGFPLCHAWACDRTSLLCTDSLPAHR